MKTCVSCLGEQIGLYSTWKRVTCYQFTLIPNHLYVQNRPLTNLIRFSNSPEDRRLDLPGRSEPARCTVKNNGVSDTRAYNSDNMLTSISFSGASIGDLSYGWDANQKQTSEPIADYTASTAASSPTYRYVYASCIDEPVSRFKASGSESLYYHRNQQYSVDALTNGSAAIVERYAYSAYGMPTITNASGNLLPEGSVDNRYMYTGREWDQTPAMYQYRA